MPHLGFHIHGKNLTMSKYLAQSILLLIAKNKSFRSSYGNITNYFDNSMHQSALMLCGMRETFNIAAGGK
jgi:hypothetical protein